MVRETLMAVQQSDDVVFGAEAWGFFVGAVGGSKLDYRYKLSIVQALSLYL